MAKSPTLPEQMHAPSVKAGDTLPLDALQLNVLSVAPSPPPTGLRGFMEIGF
ncbi:MAG: hypothetical protein FWD46_09425 [Cystobacterineae bacterium]|nr:hypothetical protein [Cystobacterineae bacterium]